MDDFIWLDAIVDKLIDKRQVYPSEAEECFLAPDYKIVRAEKDKYRLDGQSVEGRCLLVVFVWVGRDIKVISARDMTIKERRFYRRK